MIDHFASTKLTMIHLLTTTIALLWYFREIVGQTRVFDGMILYFEGGDASNLRVGILSSSQAN